ncbi:MAG: SDR family NAD(P)-dependent oxidoreductase, partial [Deltaproteobacteria bacterium]|nr:SDR family NAD(P)-dependent oxidoreductase [Deltaproteobacteria bacterium]
MDCTNRSDATLSERPLAGKTAVITGASSGIGRATALTLSEAGAAVVIQARRRDRLDRLAEDISHCGGKALIVEGDAGLEA